MLRTLCSSFVLLVACAESERGSDAGDAAAETAVDAVAETAVDTVADVAPETAVDTVADVAPETSTPTTSFVVTVPPETPEDATVHISGNHAALGDWDGIGVALERGGDGRWRTTLSFSIGTTLEFKVTRGSWETVEKDENGGEIANRTHTVASSSETIEITVASWRDLVPVPPGPPGLDFIRGVSSAYLGPTRDIVVYKPPGYDTSPARRYPVLYMHDGQNLMDPATSAFGVAWEVDDTATALIGEGRIEPVIIVGIYNTADRMSEYTPVPDPEYGGGDADDYGRFIVEELKPDIDATYRTKPEAAVTGLAGSSLGGLVSLYLGLAESDVFGRLGVVSPSVWWADRYIVGRVEALQAKLPLKIWLDMGTAEGGGGAVDDARALRDALVAEGWVEGADLIYREYPGAAHDEGAWAARTDDILEALYPPQ